MRNRAAQLLVLLFVAVFFGLTLSYGELPRPNYAYVVVTYSCRTEKNVAVFSQVFGACLLETNHSQIASGQRDTFYQVAKASCGGEVVFSGQRTSYPYQGPNAEDSANQERDKDVRDSIGYGYKVESAYLQVPYSSRCGH